MGNRRNWTEDALRFVDACAVIGLNALQVRLDDAARGDLLLENRLLDLRDRRFLNLEACRAPLRKQRHRGNHDCEKSCCHERFSSVHCVWTYTLSMRVRSTTSELTTDVDD